VIAAFVEDLDFTRYRKAYGHRWLWSISPTKLQLVADDAAKMPGVLANRNHDRREFEYMRRRDLRSMIGR
jgi:hypothetical protein